MKLLFFSANDSLCRLPTDCESFYFAAALFLRSRITPKLCTGAGTFAGAGASVSFFTFCAPTAWAEEARTSASFFSWFDFELVGYSFLVLAAV